MLGCGGGKERSGKRCGGRAQNELMRSLTFRAHMLNCEGRNNVVRGVGKCVAVWRRWGEVWGVKGRIEGVVGKCVEV